MADVSPGRFERLVLLYREACRLTRPERDAFRRRVRDEDAELGSVLDELLRKEAGHPPDEGTLAGRIEDQYGSEVDPRISLEGAGEPEVDFASEVIKRLTGRGEAYGRYRLKGELARGGQGAILRVWDEDLRRNLAMKVVLGKSESTPSETPAVDSRTLGRFLEEAQVTGQLDHPGIVPVHELGLDDHGRVYFTMKLVKGRNLRRVFDLVHDEEEGWTQTRALGVLLKVCDAMAYAHAKGVIHRDLKPSNVMVGRYGEVYVMDWGLSRVLGREDKKDIRIQPEPTSEIRTERTSGGDRDSPLITMDGDVVGTPVYMSPEQARGDPEAMGPHSDVYALGAMLYHLLAGEMPYVPPGTRPSNYAIWHRVLVGAPTPIHVLAPEAPSELVAICEKAMARERDERYADTQELADDLRAFLEQRVVLAYETGAVAELRKWVKRNKPLASAIAAAAVLLLAGLVSSLVLKARADHNAVLASEREANVQVLGARQRLQDLVQEADGLWPVHPARLADFDDWLERARALAFELEHEDHGYRTRLAGLAERALPWTDAERENDRRSHPRLGELAAHEERRRSLERAQAVRAGTAEPEERDIERAWLSLEPSGFVEKAMELIGPDRKRFGDEAYGLAFARRAVEYAADDPKALLALAWASFAVGLDDEAIAASEDALYLAGEDFRVEYTWHTLRLTAAIERAQSGETLARLEARIAALEDEVSRRRTWRFAIPGDRWRLQQLELLVPRLEEFSDPETGLIDGSSVEHGWGVQRRRDLAAALAERTTTGEEPARLWSAALASISDTNECPAYGGLVIDPQLGLLPIGRDPRSGLWEFAHVLSGAVPERDDDGQLLLTADMGIVLVLLPGGTFTMGAQPVEADEPNYDTEALADEGPPHEVTLTPFFLSKYEMTQGQWVSITGENPSAFQPPDYRAPSLLHPVEQVNWVECRDVCTRMNLQLSTDAQWEYGARAGTTSPWFTGDDPRELELVGNLMDDYYRRHYGPRNWTYANWDDGYSMHSPVGEFAPNDFGIHDVVGNLFEWCLDAYDAYYYEKSPAVDPVCEPTSERSFLVKRGAAFNDRAIFARSANRGGDTPEIETADLGLRPARALEGELSYRQ